MASSPSSIAESALYKKEVICIDSRNKRNSTNPAQYEAWFPLKSNIKMIRLITAEIPNTEYVLNATNNVIDFDAAGVFGVVAATITPGTYTANNLANEINLQMNLACGGAGMGVIFTCTYLASSMHYQIDRVDGNTFQMLWATGANTLVNAHFPLGFDNTDSAAGILITTSDDVVKLSGENYIYMCLRGLETVTNDDNVQDVFAKIVFNIPPRAVSFYSFAENARIYDTPLAKLDRFFVSFRKDDNTLYDFNTVEHSFTVEIYTL